MWDIQSLQPSQCSGTKPDASIIRFYWEIGSIGLLIAFKDAYSASEGDLRVLPFRTGMIRPDRMTFHIGYSPRAK